LGKNYADFTDFRISSLLRGAHDHDRVKGANESGREDGRESKGADQMHMALAFFAFAIIFVAFGRPP
jgi:hypothetical protein